MTIIRKLIKILSIQPGTLSNTKPKIFAATLLNKVILDPIVTKEGLDWNVKVKNVKTDLNSNNAVSLYNINRKLSYLVAYDSNIDDKVLDNYINYVNKEIEFLEDIINQTGGNKSYGTLNLDQTPSNFIINENNKRKEQVRNAFNKHNLPNEPKIELESKPEPSPKHTPKSKLEPESKHTPKHESKHTHKHTPKDIPKHTPKDIPKHEIKKSDDN